MIEDLMNKSMYVELVYSNEKREDCIDPLVRFTSSLAEWAYMEKMTHTFTLISASIMIRTKKMDNSA